MIYIIECMRSQARPQYVGKSIRCLMVRGREHINAIDRGNLEGIANGKMYEHFTSNNHSSRDLRLYAIEIVHGDEVTATVRENFWMQLLDTRRNGLNSNKS